jgi:hypothetical protein
MLANRLLIQNACIMQRSMSTQLDLAKMQPDTMLSTIRVKVGPNGMLSPFVPSELLMDYGISKREMDSYLKHVAIFQTEASLLNKPLRTNLTLLGNIYRNRSDDFYECMLCYYIGDLLPKIGLISIIPIAIIMDNI